MPELTFLKTIGGTTVLRIFSITDYPQLCKFFLLPLPYCVTICNSKKIPSQNVNSTIQGLYQRSCWCSPFFIYPSLKGRRFFSMGIAIIYWFIAIWVSVNGISSPFDDALSFFMWAAVLVPVVAGIFLLLHSDDDQKN